MDDNTAIKRARWQKICAIGVGLLTIGAMVMGLTTAHSCGGQKYLTIIFLGALVWVVIKAVVWNIVCAVFGWRDGMMVPETEEGRAMPDHIWTATALFGVVGATFLPTLAFAPCSIGGVVF